jgi:phosphoglycolate phosphatase-like HAD superfamily hydrolase
VCFTAAGLDPLFPVAARYSAQDSLPSPTSKPDPAVYLYAVKDLGLDPNSAIAVEDAVAGVASAVAAGLPGIRASVVCSTRVSMRPYSDAEIAVYVATGDPMDKAGAYAIQSHVLRPVASIDGLYSTVVGLPLGPTTHLLRRLGVALRPDAGSEPPWEPPV